MMNEFFEIEIDFKGKVKYTISAPTEKRATEILHERIENEEYNLLADGELKDWEINAIDNFLV